MNSELYYNLFNDFKISWDPEVLTKDFDTIEYKPNDITKFKINRPFWEKFNTNIIFARNFYNFFPEQCLDIIDKIKKKQLEILDSQSDLVKMFKTIEIIPYKLTLIKTIPGQNIKLHVDTTRHNVLNIGLKNSNAWDTYIFHNELPELKNLNQSNMNDFKFEKIAINDGQGILMKVGKPHAAFCLNKSVNITRYIISYTF